MAFPIFTCTGDDVTSHFLPPRIRRAVGDTVKHRLVTAFYILFSFETETNRERILNFLIMCFKFLMRWKSLYGQQVFCGFGISILFKKASNQKTEFQCFFPMKSSFKFPASATPNEVDRVMEVGAEWRHFRNISKRNAFILLAWRPHCFTNFCLFAFCRRERLTTTKTTVSWASKIWQFLTWRHDPFKNPGSYFALTHGQLHWAWLKLKL